MINYTTLLEDLQKMWEDPNDPYWSEDEEDAYLDYDDVDPEDLDFGDDYE
jgi:hypothetical protein